PAHGFLLRVTLLIRRVTRERSRPWGRLTAQFHRNRVVHAARGPRGHGAEPQPRRVRPDRHEEGGMKESRFKRPSAALVVASLALFISLGGTSYAAFKLPKNSVGTKQLKNGAVSSAKIKSGAVTAGKLNTSGLTVPNAQHANTANSATSA